MISMLSLSFLYWLLSDIGGSTDEQLLGEVRTCAKFHIDILKIERLLRVYTDRQTRFIVSVKTMELFNNKNCYFKFISFFNSWKNIVNLFYIIFILKMLSEKFWFGSQVNNTLFVISNGILWFVSIESVLYFSIN